MPKVQTSFLTVVSCFAWQVLAMGAATPSAEQVEFFENKVRPLLITQCYSCHSAEAEAKGKLKAGLHMDSLHGLLKGGDSGAALIPGNPEKSLLVEAINYRNEDMAMPPKAKLNDSEIQVLTEWVRMGAPWPGQEANQLSPSEKSASPYDWAKFRSEHWSFKPITKPAPPEVSDAAWPKGEIDRFVLAKLDAANLKPNPSGEKYILIRRAFLDLLGLPPSPEDVDAFLADEAPDPFARLVDGLLQNEAYGERWARHWMDVARYSDGYGGFGDGNALPNAWRYRDWVVKALNADMPYDQFVTRQIAGDLLAENADPVATGFFVVGPNYQADGGDAEAKAQAEAETLYDRVDTFSRGFLGLTTACARCHDHKFDPITTKDYYAIAGIFKNTTNHEVPVVPQAQIDAFNAGQKTIQEQEGVIKTFLGDAAKRLGTNPKEVEKSLDAAAKSSLAELRGELERRKKEAPAKYDVAHCLHDSGSANMPVALRGDLRKPGEMVPRRFLTIIAGEEPKLFTQGSGRLELARSVISADNPLTARVIVNRVWGWHFGEALVRTPSNFGTLGEKPSHPELLDWLAADFVEHGWSLKRLHRQIMLSATWQMSSHMDKGKFTRDGDNRLLWRMNPQRLEIEAWRDTLLAVTGELDRKQGGPPINEILESKRRTLYATISRTGDVFQSDGFLRLFDFPAAVSSSEKRTTSTVPQQYLFMLNSEFMKQRAQTLGNQLHAMQGDLPLKVTQTYRRLYSRAPEPSELNLAREWLGENAPAEQWQRYAQVLLSAHELMQLQ